jgi:hypothetical protein
MSNLSDLLPAGAGGKQVDFVATGTLASGQTVVLKTNGQVEAVSGVSDSVGTNTTFTAGNSSYISSAFDSNLNKVVIAYQDNFNSAGQGFAVVGTVSGTSISFGTPVNFETSTNVNYTSCVFDPSSNKVVIAYSIGSTGTARVATVSGTSISFGTAVTFETGDSAEYIDTTYDANAQKIVIAYRGVSNYGYAIVGTVSGTSISFGTKVAFYSTYSESYAIAYDSNAQKVVIVYYEGAVGGYGTAIVGTVSGTSISFGTAANYMTSGESKPNTIAYDSTAQKVVIAFIDVAGSSYGKAIVGTVSGTSISFGTAVVFASKSIGGINQFKIVYDSSINRVVIVYRDPNNIGETLSSVGAVSGTSLSFGSIFIVKATNNANLSAVYESNAAKVVVSYRTGGFSEGLVYAPGFTNSSSFIGITDAAISSAASGSVTIKGGISSKVTGLTANSTYYVQSNGTLSTTTSTVLAGKALSSTSINLDYTT